MSMKFTLGLSLRRASSAAITKTVASAVKVDL